MMQAYSQRGIARRIVTFTPSACKEAIQGTPDNFPLKENPLVQTNRGKQSVIVPRYQGEDAYMRPIATRFGKLEGRGSGKHVDEPHYEHASLTLREATPSSVAD
jgi:hypothetical protein